MRKRKLGQASFRSPTAQSLSSTAAHGGSSGMIGKEGGAKGATNATSDDVAWHELPEELVLQVRSGFVSESFCFNILT